MTRLLLISGKNMCKLIEKLGFSKIHQKGSHTRYVHPDGRKTVIPVHGNEDLGRGLIREILNQIKLNREDYLRLRNDL